MSSLGILCYKYAVYFIFQNKINCIIKFSLFYRIKDIFLNDSLFNIRVFLLKYSLEKEQHFGH